MTGMNPTSPTLSTSSAPAGMPADARPLRLFAIVGFFLGLSVVVHAVALFYVFSTDTDLVRSDYYQAGERHDAERIARQRGTAYELDLQHRDGTLLVTVQCAKAQTQVRSATIELYRPDDATRDRLHTLELQAGDDDIAAAALAALAPGPWRVRVSLVGAQEAVLEREVEVDAAGAISARRRAVAVAPR